MKKRIAGSSKRISFNILLYGAVILFIIFFTVLKPKFFSLKNFKSILQSMAGLGVLGISATFILTTGEIDISNGALMSIVPCFSAVLNLAGMPLIPALLLSLMIALALGFLNGILVTKVGLPAFISTFGVQGIAMGLTRIVTANKSIKVSSETLLKLFGGKTGGYPNGAFWMVAMVLLGWFILKYTAFGRKLHCIGDNPDAAAMYGIDVDKYKILAYVIAAAFACVAGMIEAMRASSVQAGTGESMMMYSIVVALIGGTLMTGGKSNPIGTLVGAFFVTVIENGLFLISVSSYLREIVVGIIILIVLSCNAIIENRIIELNRK